MSQFPGEFYFNLTSFGNLLGEFTNRGEPGMCTESSVRKIGEPSIKGFKGNYQSTWFDAQSKEAVHAELTIDPERRSKVDGRYLLVWNDPKTKKPMFHGYGFECNDMLIGHYMNGGPKE